MIIKNWTTPGIVLRRVNTGEYDRILTLHTEELGKISVIAKGARRPKSRVASHLEPGNIVRFELAEGRNLYVVTGAKIIEYLSFERLDCMQALFMWLEIIDKISHPDEPNQRLFQVITEGLRLLGSAPRPRECIYVIELGLYAHLGYAVQVSHCTVRGEALEEQGNVFSASLGGVVCQNHADKAHGAVAISKDAIKLLRLIQLHRYDIVQKLVLSEDVRNEIILIARLMRHRILEKDLRSEQL